MCAVSMVMDSKYDDWVLRYARHSPLSGTPPIPQIELDDFRRLLGRAREYDKKHNQPDCELEEKRQKVRDLAKELGVDVSFV